MNEETIPIAAPGYPDRSPDLDALPGFQNPPPGYGEVPFWWWTGEDLDVDRLLWQVRELHNKGISGVQVNYSHLDTPGWPTDHGEPALFTEAWWKIYSTISEECRKLNMGIGLSTYTLDWPNGGENLFYDQFYSKPELNAVELVHGERVHVHGGETKTIPCADDHFAARAYEIKDGQFQQGGIDLSSCIPNPEPVPLQAGSRTSHPEFSWTAPDGEWEVWTFRAERKQGTLNPLMPGAGDTVVQGFYQQFQNHNIGKTAEGLNFFFNDELAIGAGGIAWNPDFIAEFTERKGYDLLEVLPALWTDVGPITPKVRMDYADVRMSLMEERYFTPIYAWHASRGILYGCDNHGRGLEPNAYGDYFRACRWYTSPGHDTPGGHADPIKGRVSASIANLFQRPRVHLEGYHSLGWGATPEQMMYATRENYLYGCSLFSLHGFYYTTYGSHWEWAPPCYHFRMPYWEHMDHFLKYFERLSYVMSQGHTVCDVAITYPVAPYEAGMHGDQAREIAFEIGRKLLEVGINFEFIGNQSLSQAEVEDGRLVVRDAGTSYKVLVFPDMEAVRWGSIEKAARFTEGGGMVLSVGPLPVASDHAGREDAQLAAFNERTFKKENRMESPDKAVERIQGAFVQDAVGLNGTVRTLHRKVGFRDVYLVMDAKPGDVVEFRVKGAVELWDPWTGVTHSLRVVKETDTGTQVELPLENFEAQVVVFTPDAQHAGTSDGGRASPRAASTTVFKTLDDNEWRVRFEPTMINRYGDFRLPVTPDNETIGLEARRFAWAKESEDIAATAMLPETDDSAWQTQLHGYGPKGYLLGPVPETLDAATLTLDTHLAALERIDPAVPVTFEGRDYHWQPYEFSWRYGREGDPGHQGFHGLKGTISEHFIRLGKADEKLCGAAVLAEEEHKRYYLWTTAVVDEPVQATIHASTEDREIRQNDSPCTAPAVVFVNGQRVYDAQEPVSLQAGANPVLVRFDDWGEAHMVLRREEVPCPEKPEQLAMPWYKDPGVIPFDHQPGESSAEWFRFVSAPGTTAIRVKAESREPVQAWFNGEPMLDQGEGRFEVQQPIETAAVVALRLVPPAGHSGGAAIPEPVLVETSGDGTIPLGDWSKMGILNNYSGGARYRTTFTLSDQEAGNEVGIDLGRVIATAEVFVNGKSAGVRVAPPWKLDLSGLLRAGENELEVLVYNTLANHYQTIPSLYRGDPASGLFGPVELLVNDTP